MNYGIPYTGSKSRIANDILDFLPEADTLYDLFAGGCAIAHCAMVKEKYKNIVINDINPLPTQLFVDAINGKYRDEKEWISRERFFAEKDTNGYVKYCWSFGNDGTTYIYGKEKEKFKRAFHYAVMFRDYEPLKEFGYDVSFVDDIESSSDRRKAIGRFFKKLKLERYQIESQNIESLERLQRLQSMENLERLELQSGERLERVQSLERLERINGFENGQISIKRECRSYDEIELNPDSVVYCDIPYKGTKEYLKSKFDYERFYDWAVEQAKKGYKIFISEYWMPEDRFKCVWEKQKRCCLSATNNSKLTTEKIFVPIW